MSETQAQVAARRLYRELQRQRLQGPVSFEAALERAVEVGIELGQPRRVVGLTRRQHDLLEFIRSYSARRHYPPSFDEMCAALGLRSKSGVHRLVTALEERGAIARLANRARAIEITPTWSTPSQTPTEQEGR